MIPPCRIPHHAHGSRVGFHQWHNAAGVMQYRFGVVLAHHGRRVHIDLGDRVVETECGHIFPSEVVS
ncbi:hypothetical protein A5731_00590 [Mycolicibacterium conceptionense]|nr:hypothetical protein A5718_29980 [Mycolicibacterium conceptionense]OBF09240.1 hypothetical protein A5731_00590 [Mycolicibacterium conceptionense]